MREPVPGEFFGGYLGGDKSEKMSQDCALIVTDDLRDFKSCNFILFVSLPFV